jgi:hypothetical protein
MVWWLFATPLERADTIGSHRPKPVRASILLYEKQPIPFAISAQYLHRSLISFVKSGKGLRKVRSLAGFCFFCKSFRPPRQRLSLWDCCSLQHPFTVCCWRIVGGERSSLRTRIARRRKAFRCAC